MHSERLKCADNVKRDQGGSNLTCEMSVTKDMKNWGITKELAISLLFMCQNHELVAKYYGFHL
jgi:hypothetical protein